MDASEVAHRRLANQRLSGPPLPDPVAVVRHLGAVQAQEYAMAKWSLAQRSAGDDAALQRVVDDGAVIRTHALRPTWHFVVPEDLRWVQALTAPRVRAFNRYYERQTGIDDDEATRATAAMAHALRGGNHLTRAEVAAALATAGIEASGVRLAYLTMRAELDVVVVNGVRRGKQHTYALADERVPDGLGLVGDDALVELVRRFVASHGPVTVKDAAWWSSLTLTQVRHALRLLGTEVASEVVGGLEYWFVPAPAPVPEPSPTVHVLQGYDEYTVAYTEGRVVTNIAGRVIVPENTNQVIQPLVLDSQVIGWWRRVAERDRIVAEPHLAVDLTPAQDSAMRAAFDRYSTFAGLPIVVE
ncbi:hypothetical protein Cch01nite_00790 [Cellulomonas chitinilytica]|uniref:Winged helix DNA-binding domain-containing protein n=1 Tax=Cellulomonas chitinilytica TaxID=398759 RepID=A0A919TXF2_9CELL|nr:winged helix DNA-binding domain-containing protein [Cellulomonas chitinilytica]GIG19355.1 hypothetical protein Cch01nite_00790 [Cellulomonas chitinilytica]